MMNLKSFLDSLCGIFASPLTEITNFAPSISNLSFVKISIYKRSPLQGTNVHSESGRFSTESGCLSRALFDHSGQPIEENYSGGCLQRSDPRQIPQGDLDDCCFFASLIVLTKQPDLIRGIFAEPVENDVRAVAVNFCSMGERKPIIIDSRLRFKNNWPNFMRAESEAWELAPRQSDKGITSETV
jgi:hypothetical protein